MITAIDTNILIDVLHGKDKVIEDLAVASTDGQLIIGEIVYAELCAGMSMDDVQQLCKDFGIQFVHSSTHALALAGDIWRKYKMNRRESKGRVLADFLVASHARTHANRFMTYDRGFYRDYFKDLKIFSSK